MALKINTNKQIYKGIPLNCIPRKDYQIKKAKRFIINGTNQNVWIPNKHLLENGTIKCDEDIDYIFLEAERKCEIAGCSDMVKQIKENKRTEELFMYAIHYLPYEDYF